MQKTRNIIILIILFFVFICMPLVQAPRPITRNLTVAVTDTSQTPIQEALVNVYNETGAILLASGSTNQEGIYTIKLNTGVYFLVVEKTGYELEEASFELLNSMTLTIVLTGTSPVSVLTGDIALLYIGLVSVIIVVLFTIFFVLRNRRLI